MSPKTIRCRVAWPSAPSGQRWLAHRPINQIFAARHIRRSIDWTLTHRPSGCKVGVYRTFAQARTVAYLLTALYPKERWMVRGQILGTRLKDWTAARVIVKQYGLRADEPLRARNRQQEQKRA